MDGASELLRNDVTEIQVTGAARRFYEPDVLRNRLDEVLCTGRKLRLLYNVASDTRVDTLTRVIGDLSHIQRHSRRVGLCAFVAENEAGYRLLRMATRWLPVPAKVFAHDEREEALAWLATAIGGSGIHWEFLQRAQVLRVGIDRPLAAEHVASIGARLRQLALEGRTVAGIVVEGEHALPVADVGTARQLVRLLREPHQRFGRVALVSAGGSWSGLLEMALKGLTPVALRCFTHEHRERARAWASFEADKREASVAPRAA